MKLSGEWIPLILVTCMSVIDCSRVSQANETLTTNTTTASGGRDDLINQTKPCEHQPDKTEFEKLNPRLNIATDDDVVDEDEDEYDDQMDPPRQRKGGQRQRQGRRKKNKNRYRDRDRDDDEDYEGGYDDDGKRRRKKTGRKKEDCDCENKDCGCENKDCGCENKDCGCENKDCGCKNKDCGCKINCGSGNCKTNCGNCKACCSKCEKTCDNCKNNRGGCEKNCDNYEQDCCKCKNICSDCEPDGGLLCKTLPCPTAGATTKKQMPMIVWPQGPYGPTAVQQPATLPNVGPYFVPTKTATSAYCRQQPNCVPFHGMPPYNCFCKPERKR